MLPSDGDIADCFFYQKKLIAVMASESGPSRQDARGDHVQLLRIQGNRAFSLYSHPSGSPEVTAGFPQSEVFPWGRLCEASVLFSGGGSGLQVPAWAAHGDICAHRPPGPEPGVPVTPVGDNARASLFHGLLPPAPASQGEASTVSGKPHHRQWQNQARKLSLESLQVAFRSQGCVCTGLTEPVTVPVCVPVTTG